MSNSIPMANNGLARFIHNLSENFNINKNWFHIKLLSAKSVVRVGLIIIWRVQMYDVKLGNVLHRSIFSKLTSKNCSMKRFSPFTLRTPCIRFLVATDGRVAIAAMFMAFISVDLFVMDENKNYT